MSNILIKSGKKYIFSHSSVTGYNAQFLINDKPLEKSFKDGWFVSDKKPTKLTIITETSVKDKWVLKKDYENLNLEKERPADYFESDEDYEYPQESLFYQVEYKKEEKREEKDLEFDNYYEEEIKAPIYFDASSESRYGSKPILTQVTGMPSMVHSALYPSIMHPSRPTSVSGDELYKIVRYHVRENINPKYAKITSDYDFCFTVKKQIGIEPIHKTRDARVGRQRKPRLVSYTVNDREVQLFEMTPPSKKYQGYTPIKGISADNHEQLKERIDEFLNNLMEQINEPLETCNKCKGDGVILVKNNG